MWVLRVLIIGFCVMALLFMGIGSGLALTQARKFETWLPVEARVLSRSVETVRGSKSTTNRPRVTYRYSVNGHAYESSDVTIGNESSSGGWAGRAIRRFPVGSTTTAYYNPADPSQAYLLRELSFFPYIFILFPMIHLSVAVGLALGTGFARFPRARPPEAMSRGWFILAPWRSLWFQLRAWVVVLLLWYGVGAMALGHYYLYAGQPYPLEARLATWIYPGLGIIPLVGTLYFLLLMSRCSEASVLVRARDFVCGESFEARVMIPFRRKADIQKLEVGLICDKHTKTKSGNSTSYKQKMDYEQWHTLLTDQVVGPGQSLDFVQLLEIPSDRSGTVEDGYPRYTWKISVRAALRKSPDYSLDCMIDVRPSNSAVAIPKIPPTV